MVPLPDAPQLFSVEVIAADVWSVWLRLLRLSRNRHKPWLEPRAGCPSEVSLQSHHGPAVFPCHGHEAHGAANGVEIHHEECPPRAVLILNDTTLMGIGAGCGILIERAKAELRAVLADAVFHATWHLRERCGMVAVCFVCRDDTCLVRSPDALGARAKGAAIGLVVGRDEVVHAVNLIHVVSFSHTVPFGDDDTLRSLDGTAHVRFQFCTLHGAVAVNGIHLAVIVEEYAEVVDVALHVVVRPRAFDVLGRVALQSLPVHVGKHIKLSVGIADARCPNALTVNLLMILQRKTVFAEIEAVKAVGDILPVHKVFRVENHKARHRMHRGASQIVVIAHPQNVWVGELIVEQRIGERAIAIVGCPRLSIQHASPQQGGKQEKK